MSQETKYHISEFDFDEIVRLYREGITLKELEARYKIPYYILRNRLYDNSVRINVSDSMSENCGLIQMAESKLIQMAKDMKQGEFGKLDQYKELLFWTSKADLNEGMVFIPTTLLR